MSSVMPLTEPTSRLSSGTATRARFVVDDGRVDQHQPGDGVAALLGQPQGQAAAHRQPADEDLVALRGEPVEGPDASAYQSVHVVLFSSCQVVPCPGSRGTDDGEALAGEVLAPGPHRRTATR